MGKSGAYKSKLGDNFTIKYIKPLDIENKKFYAGLVQSLFLYFIVLISSITINLVVGSFLSQSVNRVMCICMDHLRTLVSQIKTLGTLFSNPRKIKDRISNLKIVYKNKPC